MTATGLAIGTLALVTMPATNDTRAQTFQGYSVLGGGSYSNQFASGRLAPTIAGGADALIAGRFGVEGKVGLDEFYAEYLHVIQSTQDGWTENHDLMRVGVSFR